MAQPHAAPAGQAATGRLVSLDAFRGATIALMVLVNTAGGFRDTYAPLKHAEWHGWTPTDVVFPSFLWIVGLTLTLSLAKRVAEGVPRAKLVGQILRRGVILYALGLFLYGFPSFDLGTWRILGVLQRIAICYVAAALIYLWTGLRGQIAWIVGLLAAYTILMTAVPVPGYGAGRFDEAGNFAHYIDRLCWVRITMRRQRPGIRKAWSARCRRSRRRSSESWRDMFSGPEKHSLNVRRGCSSSATCCWSQD